MTDTPPAPPAETLLGQLHQAQALVQPVAASGRNEKHKYDYVKAEDLIKEGRRALHEANLVATVGFSDQAERDVTSSGGNAGLYVTVTAHLTIAHPGTGEVVVVDGFGAGIDYPGDKAVYKAQTGAAKYAYSSALGIASGGADGEAGGAGDLERQAGLPEATPEQKGEASAALTQLMGGDKDKAVQVWGEVKNLFGGKLPAPVADALSVVALYQRGAETDPPGDTRDLPPSTPTHE